MSGHLLCEGFFLSKRNILRKGYGLKSTENKDIQSRAGLKSFKSKLTYVHTEWDHQNTQSILFLKAHKGKSMYTMHTYHAVFPLQFVFFVKYDGSGDHYSLFNHSSKWSMSNLSELYFFSRKS